MSLTAYVLLLTIGTIGIHNVVFTEKFPSIKSIAVTLKKHQYFAIEGGMVV